MARSFAQVVLYCHRALLASLQHHSSQSNPPPPPPNVISLLLLLLSTRDCAKSLVSRAGTVSRVHVSSQSGGWRTDGSAAGPQPRQAGRQEEKRGREGQRGGRGWMLQANQAGSWQSQHARVSSCRKNPVCKTGGGGRLMCALLGG